MNLKAICNVFQFQIETERQAKVKQLIEGYAERSNESQKNVVVVEFFVCFFSSKNYEETHST